MQIRAAVLRAHEQPLVIEGVELDDPRPNEAVVRLISSSLCHTDLVTRDCYHTIPLPCVPGHEDAGAVEAAGAVYTCATWITLSWVLRPMACARIVCTGLLTVRTPGRCCGMARADGSPTMHRGPIRLSTGISSARHRLPRTLWLEQLA